MTSASPANHGSHRARGRQCTSRSATHPAAAPATKTSAICSQPAEPDKETASSACAPATIASATTRVERRKSTPSRRCQTASSSIGKIRSGSASAGSMRSSSACPPPIQVSNATSAAIETARTTGRRDNIVTGPICARAAIRDRAQDRERSRPRARPAAPSRVSRHFHLSTMGTPAEPPVLRAERRCLSLHPASSPRQRSQRRSRHFRGRGRRSIPPCRRATAPSAPQRYRSATAASCR